MGLLDNFVVDISTSENGKQLKSYKVWHNMIDRCYNPNHKFYDLYSNVSVDKVWHVYSNFKNWYDENYKEGYQLDKDILGDGNSYSPTNCCLIPKWLNVFMIGYNRKGYSPEFSGWRASAQYRGKTFKRLVKSIDEAIKVRNELRAKAADMAKIDASAEGLHINIINNIR